MKKAPPSPLPDDPSFRYEDLGLIGKGAMGEVRRVRDRDLNRVVAMKIVRSGRMKNRRLLARFIAEAQATAQLTHPSIVPIHELGVLPDGRFYFTMKEVEGTTLRQVIKRLHRKSRLRDKSPIHDEPNQWTLRGVVGVYKKVCDAMAYAHSRGVVHRDLKPDNVMVGDYGEVLVLDWGLAKVTGHLLDELGKDDVQPVVTNRSGDSALQTQVGTVAGTPSYMPPEQARGEFATLRPEADVYSLGAILYEVLTGTPPFLSKDAKEIIGRILDGETPVPLEGGQRGPIPAELIAIVERAMQREPEQRYPHAGALVLDVERWVEGVVRQEQSLLMVAQAKTLWPRIDAGKRQATTLRRQADHILATTPSHAPADRKVPAWQIQDRADQAEREAAMLETEFVQLLSAALSYAPDLDEPHDLLADYYRALHVQAERARRTTEALQYEALLRAHDRGRHAEYLKGAAHLSLRTDAPDAEVFVLQYVNRARRLVPRSRGLVGTTPLVDIELPSGSYMFILRKPGHIDLRYPVHLRRLERWDGVRPGDIKPAIIHHPTTEEILPDECYVPAGWFQSGGDPDAPGASPMRRVWLDSYAIQRFPVTVNQYLEFMNDLLERGREADALDVAPRQQGGRNDRGSLLVHRDADGRFVLPPYPDETLWRGDWPITMIDWYGAMAYGSWRAERDAMPWRLPGELEWEKAARGVDGRLYPWGDFLDPSFCSMRESNPKWLERVAVDCYPMDESPYLVRGMAGNVTDFCLDVYRSEGPAIQPNGIGTPTIPSDLLPKAPRGERGGSWRAPVAATRLASRNWSMPTRRSPNRGFRLVRPIVD